MGAKLALLVVLLIAPSYAGGREFEQRIILQQGQTAAAVTGHIPTPGDSVLFTFSAQSGQYVAIRLKPSRRLVAQAVLIFPSDKQEGPGTDLHRRVDESGTYRIRVTSREQTAGAFRLYFNLR